ECPACPPERFAHRPGSGSPECDSASSADAARRWRPFVRRACLRVLTCPHSVGPQSLRNQSGRTCPQELYASLAAATSDGREYPLVRVLIRRSNRKRELQLHHWIAEEIPRAPHIWIYDSTFG